jgi:polygalacturonase
MTDETYRWLLSLKAPVLLPASAGSFSDPKLTGKDGAWYLRVTQEGERRFFFTEDFSWLDEADPAADAVYGAEWKDEVRDEKHGFFIRVREKDGSILLAISRDGCAWMDFERDEADHPECGTVYEGDYFQAIPRGQYIREQRPENIPGITAEKIFDIRDFGAVPNRHFLNTDVIQAAIDAASLVGGLVLVKGGSFTTGTLYLKSGMTLFVDRDSRLEASHCREKITDAVLITKDARNVEVTGGGVINGSGEYFVHLPLRRPLLEPLDKTKVPPVLYDNMGYPVDTIRYAYRSRIRYVSDPYGNGDGVYSRPMYFVWFRNSQNVKVNNIILQDACDWSLVLDGCTDVSVSDTIIDDNRHVANTDGIDIMACEDVEIRHCFVSSADDGICVKAPRIHEHDGEDIQDGSASMRPTRRVAISDCTVTSVMNGFKIGTETYYDISDISIENCHFYLPDIAPGMVSGISIESCDGTHVENVSVKNIRMEQVVCPVFIQLNRRNKFGFTSEEDRKARENGGSIRNVRIEGVDSVDAELPSVITGFTDGRGVTRRVENIVLKDFKVRYRDNIADLNPQPQTAENVDQYPESNALGDVPAAALFVRHAENVKIQSFKAWLRTGEKREAFRAEDVRDILHMRDKNAGSCV